MYKIIDPEAFIKATSYRKFIPAKVIVRFDYTDEFENTDRQLVIAFGPGGNWSVGQAEDAEVTVRCNLADLSSLLMGSCSFSALLRLGALELSNTEYE